MSMPAATFKIIGGDGREYGPVELATMQQWIREGRVRQNTRVWDSRTGPTSGWQTAADVPELNQLFTQPAAPPPLSTPPPLTASATETPPPGMELAQQIRQRGYNVAIGDWFSEGWNLFKTDLGFVLGAFWLTMGILFFGGLIGTVISCLIPFANFLVGFAIQPPLFAGLWLVFLARRRGQPASIDSIFSGFQRFWLQSVLLMLMIGLVMLLASLPGIMVILVALVLGVISFSTQSGISMPPEAGVALGVLLGLIALVLIAIPVLYFKVAYYFGFPLVADRRMAFWDAMETSRRVVNQHWFGIFALIVLLGLLNFVGMLCCCVGFVFTGPFSMCVLAAAYDGIFGAPAQPATSSSEKQ